MKTKKTPSLVNFGPILSVLWQAKNFFEKSTSVTFFCVLVSTPALNFRKKKEPTEFQKS